MDYDVVIVGGGPAGCHLARTLAKKHVRVMLLEQFPTFEANNFSSAGTPLRTLNEFDIPKEAIGSYWTRIKVTSSNNEYVWKSKNNLGAVLDFATLRKLRAREAAAHGAKIVMGQRYHSCDIHEDHTVVHFGKGKTVTTNVLVDATGAARAVIDAFAPCEHQKAIALGIEYLIETQEQIPTDTLHFFLGRAWMPNGYAWVFPMQKGLYKVGAGYIKHKTRYDLKKHVERILHEYLKLKTYKVVDVHGGTLKYALHRRESFHYKNILAIGDACSTLNTLGGEGIRHAMHCADIATPHILAHLQYGSGFNKYERQAKRYQRIRYIISEFLCKVVYMKFPDHAYDQLVQILKKLSAKYLTDILFNYRFHVAWKLLSYKNLRGFIKVLRLPHN